MAQTKGYSLCPHLMQEYFKRVEAIIHTYKSQLVKFVNYESVGKLLLNRKIIRQEEHDSILQMEGGDESKMSKTLDILQNRMWGLENLVTVLIEINVDSWLVEEMFEKYVKYIVNEIRRLQALKDCKCFEHEKSSFIRRAVFRFFEKCDKWLFEVGTSIGFMTQTIYPTHNSLQFINNWFPLTRKTDEILPLASIEYTPFEYNRHSQPDQNLVEITEVATDSEKYSSSASSHTMEEDNKSVPSSPVQKQSKKVDRGTSVVRPQIPTKRLLSSSTSKTKKEPVVRPNPVIQASAPLVKSIRSPTAMAFPHQVVTLTSNSLKLDKMSSQEIPNSEKINQEMSLVSPTSVLNFASSGSLGSSVMDDSEYKSSLVFLPMRLQFPTKIGADVASLSGTDNLSSNQNDGNNNCFVLSSIPFDQTMGSKVNNFKAIDVSAASDTSSADNNLTILHDAFTASSVNGSVTSSSILSAVKTPSASNASLKSNLKKKSSSIPKMKIRQSNKSSPKVNQPSTLKVLKPFKSTLSSSEEDVFVDAQPFLESENSPKSDNLGNDDNNNKIETKILCNFDDKLNHQKESLDKEIQIDSSIVASQSDTVTTEKTTVEPKKISINGRLVERRIQNSRLILGKVIKISNSESNSRPNRLSSSKVSKSISSPKTISQSGKGNSDTSSPSQNGTKFTTIRKTKSETGIFKTSDKSLHANSNQEKSIVKSKSSKSVDKLTSRHTISSVTSKTKDDKVKSQEIKTEQGEQLCGSQTLSIESDSGEGKENINNKLNNSPKVSLLKTLPKSKLIIQNVKPSNKTSIRDKINPVSPIKIRQVQQIKTLPMKTVHNNTSNNKSAVNVNTTTVDKSKFSLKSSSTPKSDKARGLSRGLMSTAKVTTSKQKENTCPLRSPETQTEIIKDSVPSIKSELIQQQEKTPTSSKDSILEISVEDMTSKRTLLVNPKVLFTNVDQQTCLIKEEEQQVISASSPHRSDHGLAFKIVKSKSCPSLTLTDEQYKSAVVYKTKSESKLNQICPDELTLEVYNLRSTLNNLTIESLNKILSRVQEDSSSSSESLKSEVVDNTNKCGSNSVSISDSPVLHVADTKLLVDASSQTVLKMKTIVPISRPDKILTPRSVTSKSDESNSKSDPRSKKYGSTNPSSIPNHKVVNLPLQQQNSVCPTKNDFTEKVTKVNSTRPAWSNKKATPIPLASTTDRFTFSEDYNFQLWANEWASRQEKKKRTDDGSLINH